MTWFAQAFPFADAWGMHGGDVGIGWWLVMTLGMVLFWGAVIAIVVWAVRGGSSSGRPSSASPGEPSAREILDRRLADGSIDVEEYGHRRRLLDDGPDREPVGPGAGR